MKYRVLISVDDDENEVTSERKCKHSDEEGMASFGWCLGTDIAIAICSLKSDLVHEDFIDIFQAIGDRATEEENAEKGE